MVQGRAWCWFLAGLILAVGFFTPTAKGRDKIAVHAGRIIPMEGEEIEDGWILIEGGKIRAIGRDVEVPYDFWVIDASDRVVFPGMVESLTSRGLDRANESQPVTPFLDVYDAIDPSSYHFEEALRNGTTTLLISQGPDTVIGGLARVVKPIGMTVEEMTVRPEAGIVLSFAPKDGSDRMIQMSILRETFRELDLYLENLAETRYEEKQKEEGKTVDVAPEEARKRGRDLIRDEDVDFKHLNLLRLVRGDLLPLLYCATALDVLHALDFAREHGFMDRSVLVIDNACLKALDLIKASGRPVILDPGMIYRETDPLTREETEVFLPTLFYEAGIPFAVRSHPSAEFGLRYLWYQAARLVRNGLPRHVALAAITSVPARILELDSRVGALAPGRDANLLILSGDPLAGDTWVEQVIIEGKVVYEKEKDYRLKELLTGEEREGSLKDEE